MFFSLKGGMRISGRVHKCAEMDLHVSFFYATPILLAKLVGDHFGVDMIEINLNPVMYSATETRKQCIHRVCVISTYLNMSCVFQLVVFLSSLPALAFYSLFPTHDYHLFSSALLFFLLSYSPSTFLLFVLP